MALRARSRARARRRDPVAGRPRRHRPPATAAKTNQPKEQPPGRRLAASLARGDSTARRLTRPPTRALASPLAPTRPHSWALTPPPPAGDGRKKEQAKKTTAGPAAASLARGDSSASGLTRSVAIQRIADGDAAARHFTGRQRCPRGGECELFPVS